MDKLAVRQWENKESMKLLLTDKSLLFLLIKWKSWK